MAFTPYSTPVEPVEWKPPVSEDLLLKGALFTDKNIQDNTQKANDIIDQLYNIPSLPGEDTKKKQEIIDGVLQQVSKISHNDFRNPSTLNQLKGYISQVTSNPDFMGIAERGTVTEIETKKQADALAKGKTYYSPILNQAEKYMNQGLYIRDTKFNGQGFLDPEVAKMTTEALKNVPVEKYVDANGKVSVRPKKDALDFEINNVYSNPQVQQYLDYQFDEKYLDRDWATEGALQVQEEMNIFSQTRDFYKNALAKDPNNIEFQQGLYNSERLLQSGEAVLKNPGLNGENLKQLQKQIELQEQMEDAKKVYNYNSFEKWDVNPLVQQAQKHAHQLSETYAQGEKEIRVNEAKNESDYKHLKTAVDEGYKHVTNDQGGNTQENENTLKLYIGDKEFTVENIRKKVKSGDTKFITTMLEANPDMLPGERSYTEIKHDPKNRVYTNEDGETLLGESDILNAYGISQLEESAFNLNDYLKAKGLK